jgi:DNA-binding CsgD family transcriptional regulator
LTPATKTKWGRVAAHIAAGHRLRRRLQRGRDATPEAVLAPDGKVVHAEGEATAKEARERLRESARTRERAHGSLRRKDPDLAVAEWKGLVAARWTLVDQFENDGRRYLVARRNDVEMIGLESLSPRERAAVGFAALGHTNKLIAYEMGIAASTVAVLLSRAARRLGVRSRAELVRRFVEEATSRKS